MAAEAQQVADEYSAPVERRELLDMCMAFILNGKIVELVASQGATTPKEVADSIVNVAVHTIDSIDEAAENWERK